MNKLNNFKFLYFFIILYLCINQATLLANSKDEQLISEAKILIEKHGFFSKAPASINNETITAYLNRYDIFTQHLSQTDYNNIQSSKNYKGLGVNLILNQNNDIICLPWLNSPAERSGLKYGDILLEINDKSIKNLKLYDLSRFIKTANDTIKIKILTANKEEKVFFIKKEEVKLNTVKYKEFNDFNYIRITGFNKKTYIHFKKELKKINPKKAIILDLRGNTGGFLEEANKIANLFLDKGLTIYKSTNKNSKVKTLKSKGTKKIQQEKIIIWQDNLTASAAEMLTAALVENKAAISLGENSFGKNLAQDPFRSKIEGYYYLSTLKLTAPLGTDYYLKGLKPSIILNETTESNYFEKSINILNSL